MFENISLAFQGIWSHKLRSFLTMLGIIIGIAAIITIVSTITGINEQIKTNLIGSGTNVVNVTINADGYPADFSYGSIPQGIGTISEELRASLDELPSVLETSLYRKRDWADEVYFKNNSFNGAIYGVDSHYFSVAGYDVQYGRGFTETDFERARKVAMVDDTAASGLFAGENPVGQTIEFRGEPFTIIGIVSERVENSPVINSVDDYYMYANTSGGTIFIPINCWDIVYRYDEPQSVAVHAEGTDEMTTAGTNVADALKESGVITNDYFSYEADDLLQQAAELQSLSESANNQLIWIAGISLLVGGIGVMNIMLVSVTERTREIGLKIAIGARQSRIMWQFLTEAAVLTSLGGVIGVGGGIGLAYMLSNVMGTPVGISIPACVVAVVFSMVIGIVFGLVPAVKASKLNPIEALRRE